MNRTLLYIIIGVLVTLLTASCGRQQQAKSVVKDFLKANIADYSKVDYLDIGDVDSTRVINDSLLLAMRRSTHNHFRQDIKYQPRNEKTLFLLRVKYLYEQDTCSATFYMDAQLQGVVAFKEN